MDDAGGGRRDSRAVVSRDLWEVLATRWAIPLQQGRDLGGSLNLNLRVSRGDDRLVVRVHRPSVSPARLRDIQAVRDRLDHAGVPCSALVAARDGARWARTGDRLVEVERFIPHDAGMNTPRRLARGLPLLGRIHALLADMEVSPAGRAAEFANHIEPGRVLSGTRAGTARIRRWQPTPDERQLASQAERLAGLVTAGEAELAAGLPRQLVHGDFWDDNVFFRGQDPVFDARRRAHRPGTRPSHRSRHRTRPAADRRHPRLADRAILTPTRRSGSPPALPHLSGPVAFPGHGALSRGWLASDVRCPGTMIDGVVVQAGYPRCPGACGR